MVEVSLLTIKANSPRIPKEVKRLILAVSLLKANSLLTLLKVNSLSIHPKEVKYLILKLEHPHTHNSKDSLHTLPTTEAY